MYPYQQGYRIFTFNFSNKDQILSTPFSPLDWIADFNGFHFNCSSIKDMSFLNASISLKDKLLLELISGVVLWMIWLERNN